MTAAASGTSYIDALLPPDQYRWNHSAPGTPLTVTYGFMTTMPWYSSQYESGPFQEFMVAQRDGVERAIALYEQVANIDFVFRADGDNAQIRFGSADLGDFEAAHTYYPEPTGDWAGDVWFNVTDPDVYNQSAGTYGFMVTLHEIGHALGLKHSFDDGSGFFPALPFDKDNRQYTVMSYNDPASTPSLEPASPMLYDIAALQYLYGANTSYKSGNDTWRWNPNETFLWAIWDGGGTDTLDASNQTRRVILDLTPGSFSSLGSYNGGDALNNLAIAYNCWIENALGGSGNDTITGNVLANRLEGNGGNDRIYGNDGNDTLLGGAGDDTLLGGAGVDYFDGGSGLDIVSFADSAGGVTAADYAGETFVSIEQIWGSDYADVLTAVSGLGRLVGSGGDDTLISGAGADVLDGGTGLDLVSYTNSTSAVQINLATGSLVGAHAGGDTLFSIEGVVGSAFDDTLIGNGFANSLVGGAGNDTLDGGASLDFFNGGSGDDVYYLDDINEHVTELAGGGIDEIRTTAPQNGFSLDDNVEKLTFVGVGNFSGIGNSLDNVITGGAGNDTLDGGFHGRDTLIGGGGDDLLIAGIDASTFIGGDGFDTVSFTRFGGVTIDLAGGAQSTQHTFSGIEAVIGSSGYADLLRGDAGNNTFRGLGANDTIDGRGGHDVALYSGAASDYEVTEQGNVKTVRARRTSLNENTDTLIDVEEIRFLGENVNRAPTLGGVISSGVSRNGTASLTSFVMTHDANDDFMQRYEIRELTAGGGYLTLSGVVQQVGQVISIAASEVHSGLLYHAGPGSADADQIEVRVSDGVAWSDWRTVTIAPTNRAPSVLANWGQYNHPAHGTTVVAASNLFTTSDIDGDPILQYRFVDRSAGNGYFRFNGVAQPDGQVLQINAAQLGSVEYVVSSVTATVDQIEISAFDGFDWTTSGLWINAPQNALPVVAAGNISPTHGAGFVAASSMLSATDGDGDTITQYEFRDNTAGHGYFRLNGVQQAASFQIAASQLANLQFVPTATAGGQDMIGVRAFDSYGWGAWKSFTVGAVPNAAPMVYPTNAVGARGTSSMAASSLIVVTDGDGDAMTRYRFFDGTTGNGRFLLSGAAQAENVNIQVTAAQLANLHFAFGAPGATDIVWAQVFDGFVWSDWTTFSVTAPQNSAPVTSINTASLNPSKGTATIAASSFFSASDSDGDTITQYRFFDGTSGNGWFERNGTPEAELANITVNAADLASFRFRLGAGSDVLWVQAYDGAVWGAWKSFTVAAPANIAPTVNVQPLNPSKSTAFIAGSALFTVTDPDDASMARYRFFDGNAGNGRFQLNGVDQAELANVEINASDLANFRYSTSTSGAGDLLWVQAYDGTAWSTWKSFMANAPVNIAPTVNVQPLNPLKSTAFIAGSALFTVTDPDDASMTKYRFFDGNAGNGRFQLNGADQAELANVEINASDLANFRYRTSTTGAGDLLWVQAFDGFAWGAWKSFMASAPVNVAPTVNVQTLNPSKGTSFISAANLFTVTDPDDATVARLRFFDGNAGNGRFQFNGVDQVELANIEIAAADLANLRFRLGGGSDLLWVQAFDGFAWSTWKSFTVNAPVNAAPTVFVEDLVYGDNAVLDASTLFVVNDPDDANMVSYRFWDSEANSGYFRLNGVAMQEQRNVEIAAADLANLDYVGVGYSRDTIWVQAFDGMAWSQWKTFEARAWNYGSSYTSGITITLINPVFNEPPAVTVSNTNAQSGTAVSISNLISATDPEGDTITAWRFRDTTTGRGVFRVGGVVQSDLQQVEVMANQLDSVAFLAGTTAGFNKITASAFDGTSWSDPKVFIINTLAPV